MMDKFKTMETLEQQTAEHQDWKIETEDNHSQVVIIAPHGGGIEPATTELTKLIAKEGNYNYFVFNGMRSKGNQELHVTSIHYDNKIAIDLVKRSERTIAIHGCKGESPIVYIGGKDELLSKKISNSLKQIGIKVAHAPSNMSGKQSNNIVNCNQLGAGVQLELTSALRKQLFKNGKYGYHNRTNKDNWSNLMYQIAQAIVESTAQVN